MVLRMLRRCAALFVLAAGLAWGAEGAVDFENACPDGQRLVKVTRLDAADVRVDFVDPDAPPSLDARFVCVPLGAAETARFDVAEKLSLAAGRDAGLAAVADATADKARFDVAVAILRDASRYTPVWHEYGLDPAAWERYADALRARILVREPGTALAVVPKPYTPPPSPAPVVAVPATVVTAPATRTLTFEELVAAEFASAGSTRAVSDVKKRLKREWPDRHGAHRTINEAARDREREVKHGGYVYW